MAGYEFPRSLRLLKPGDFRNVFNDARFKAGHPGLLLLAIPNQLPHPRVGLVIAKKNIKLATGRNRVRRLIREAFRLQQANLPSVDIVVLARKAVADMNNEEIFQCLTKLYSRIGQQHANAVAKADSSSAT
ncbi:ribonuclease P protein component [Hahella sp. KA22]|uniref:ribonuclease P protein component n=1 Tax=Hahella sp. KA22 TaxID=1628392 RepID=UPI000FDD4886|nr:ribonuclease P protein component [Hahella sp. KA22]AZZ95368.1 ribonuclease P protein component [Hahella sp. KA22]QAY53013.1 ribonuclease P protein component [Hahella sp. KA22]